MLPSVSKIPPAMEIIYDEENDHRAFQKQVSDDLVFAAEPASFVQRAIRWSKTLGSSRRISDDFYGRSVCLSGC